MILCIRNHILSILNNMTSIILLYSDEFGLVRDDERMAALEPREYLVDDRIERLKKFDLKVTEWAERGGDQLMGGGLRRVEMVPTCRY